MTTVSVPVSELTGPALDWAVAKCEYPAFESDPCMDIGNHRRYSREWTHGGPIIERESLSVMPAAGEGWRTYKTHRIDWASQYYANGPTPLIAAMRCYVASKLGSVVEVPLELLSTASSAASCA
jgi:hypothetical protein